MDVEMIIGGCQQQEDGGIGKMGEGV